MADPSLDNMTLEDAKREIERLRAELEYAQYWLDWSRETLNKLLPEMPPEDDIPEDEIAEALASSKPVEEFLKEVAAEAKRLQASQ